MTKLIGNIIELVYLSILSLVFIVFGYLTWRNSITSSDWNKFSAKVHPSNFEVLEKNTKKLSPANGNKYTAVMLFAMGVMLLVAVIILFTVRLNNGGYTL